MCRDRMAIQSFRWLIWAVMVLAGTIGNASAAPTGDGGGLLGILDVNTLTQIDDLFATEDPSILSADPGTMQFGPFPSTTGDSGTCGPDWATDTVNRFFMIRQVGPTMFSVIEKFKGGSFVSIVAPSGPSPGACDSSDGTPPGIINAGVTGTFHGYLVMTITSATYSPSTAACPSPCAFTGEFLVSVFGPAFVRTDNAFFFHYVADQPNSLVFHEWKNASCARGGDHGDIASATGLGLDTPTCP
jgi:hypothetical protein